MPNLYISPNRPGITYEEKQCIASTFTHDYNIVVETPRQNERSSAACRLLITMKTADFAMFSSWYHTLSACSDPAIMKPLDCWQLPNGYLQWVSSSAFPLNTQCQTVSDFLRGCRTGCSTLLKRALSCLCSAAYCGQNVNQLFFNAEKGVLMADTSPQSSMSVNPAILVQSISNTQPELFRLLIGHANSYEELIRTIEQCEQGYTPYQTVSIPGRSFHQPTPSSSSFAQQIGEAIGNIWNSALKPSHGAGAQPYQPRHEAPAQPAAPRSNGTFTWNPDPDKFCKQPPQQSAQTPAQHAQPAARANAQPAFQRRTTPPQQPAPAPQRNQVKPVPTSKPPLQQAQPKPAPTLQPTQPTPAQTARPAQTKPAAPNHPRSWDAKKEYRFRDLPAIGASCAAVSLSSGALVRFELHSRQEQALHRMVKAVLEQQSDHPIEQTEGLCQLHDVKDFDKSFLIIREHVAAEGYLPVGHPTLLALELKDKLAIARSMAAIFASLTEAGWLPTRIIESAMLAHPKTHRVIFPDGHLLSRSDDAPLTATLGYAPPESLEGEAKATLSAAHYALSVWLYRLFVGGFPLEGRRTIAALEASGKTEEELAPQLYGANAAFCFSGSGDNGVEGLGGRFDEQARRWKALPDALRIAWAKSFISGLHKTPEDRRTPAQWLEILDGLQRA